MDTLLQIAAANLLTPLVLFFALGVAAGVVRSDLALPEAISKGLSIYLMLAIGFKGGVDLVGNDITTMIIITLLVGVLLSFTLPVIAYTLLRFITRLDSTNAAAISAHYGSISIVTFVATTGFLGHKGFTYEGYLVAMMALMEAPAIISGLLLARRGSTDLSAPRKPVMSKKVAHEVFLSGSIVLLVGSFMIGWITGSDGMSIMAPVVQEPFKAVLAVFLLDMGLLVGRRLGDIGAVGRSLVAFGIIMPLIGATFGLAFGYLTGLSVGGTTLFAVLAASASYIVVPAAMRISLPKANPAFYVTLSLGVTFPFNLVIGIPLYFEVAQMIVTT